MNEFVDYRSVAADLQARREEVERRIGALQGERMALTAALAAIAPYIGGAATPDVEPSAYDRNGNYVSTAGKWVTHSEIVLGLSGGFGLGFSRQRHVLRTQIGQLVQRGILRQERRLVGLPSWEPPETSHPVNIALVSGRNGRRAHIC